MRLRKSSYIFHTQPPKPGSVIKNTSTWGEHAPEALAALERLGGE